MLIPRTHAHMHIRLVFTGSVGYGRLSLRRELACSVSLFVLNAVV